MLDLQNTIECFKYGIESAINGMNHHFRKKINSIVQEKESKFISSEDLFGRKQLIIEMKEISTDSSLEDDDKTKRCYKFSLEHFSELTQLTDENNNKVPICICSKNKTSELCELTLFGDDGFWEHSLINIKGKKYWNFKKMTAI